MKAYIVWNEDKTEGFVTTSPSLAYEVRKSASTNCTTEDGTPSPVAAAFCEQWWMDNCTKEEIETEDFIASHEELKALKQRREQERRAAASGYTQVDEEQAENELNLGEDDESEPHEIEPEPAEEDLPLPARWLNKD